MKVAVQILSETNKLLFLIDILPPYMNYYLPIVAASVTVEGLHQTAYLVDP